METMPHSPDTPSGSLTQAAPGQQPATVLTCAQPSNLLHLGNYLGALRHWVAAQDKHRCFFGIVDLHAITLPYTPSQLRQHTLSCVAQYMACGIDPAKAAIFVQSHVRGHTELAWILGCLAPIGQLERMTQYKDKSQRAGESVGAGLLYYPVLMAADILLYQAAYVPVGEDQKQHLELARDLAHKFNHTYSPTFTLPEPLIHSTGARVMSLQNPSAKMSKSDPHTQGTVFLFEPVDSIRKKILSAVTDSQAHVHLAPDQPGISNLLHILAALTQHDPQELAGQFGQQGYAPFKAAVADAVISLLEPLQQRYQTLIEDKAYLMQVLREGQHKAQQVADRTLRKVYRKAGFLES
jgi:tryptophanyl-tRNA synthetase